MKNTEPSRAVDLLPMISIPDIQSASKSRALVSDVKQTAISRVVHLWLIPCKPIEATGAFASLSAQEQRRAGAFVSQEHRRRYVQAHAGLRQILNLYTGLSPEAHRFATGPSGKPYLENSLSVPLNFNLSHSGELAAVAVGNVADIGVDVEVVRPVPDWEQIARSSFHPSETNWLTAAEPHLQIDRFFQIWTAKEAYIKASGRGMSHPLESFTVSGPDRQQDYVMANLALGNGYAGALAYQPPECQVSVHRWKLN